MERVHGGYAGHFKGQNDVAVVISVGLLADQRKIGFDATIFLVSSALKFTNEKNSYKNIQKRVELP